jgi:hypothetical protein
MNYNSKAKLATLLRKKSIPYTTNSNQLIVSSIHISFFPEEETITFRHPQFSSIHFNTHYAHPHTLLDKLHTFHNMIKLMARGKAVFNIPIFHN